MRIKVRKPDDFHVHLREWPAMEYYVQEMAHEFARAIVMPNTKPAILTAEDAVRYRGEILKAAQRSAFKPLMTIKLGKRTTQGIILAAKAVDVLAGKFYPEGTTTNADGGLSSLKEMVDVLKAMEMCGMLLLVHAEHPKAFCLDREERFIEEIVWAAETFPRLKIVVEHVTSAKMVEAVKGLRDGVAATITAHHLILTLDDVVGGLIRPHHFCKPLAKRPEDRAALLEAVISGNPRFFFGSDSAPHKKQAKECAEGCAGIYTTPVAMSVLADIFHSHDALDKLEDFTSRFGAEFYGLPLNDSFLTLGQESWMVKHGYFGVVPFMAGKQLKWRVIR